MPEALYLMRRSSRELPLKWLGCGCRKTHLVCIPRAPWVCQRHPYGAVYFHAPSDQEAWRLRGPYAMNHNLVEQGKRFHVRARNFGRLEPQREETRQEVLRMAVGEP